jgi:hypothetical protein
LNGPVEAANFNRMRTMLRVLLCLAISASIALAMVPVQSAVPQIEKTSCCAKTKVKEPAKDCGHPAPKSDQEKQCCAACAFGLGLFLTSTAPFIHPPSTEESFATISARARIRAHRPPVPPPRAEVA